VCSHTWSLVDRALRRYRCSLCQCIGYAPFGRPGVKAYKCQHYLDTGKHCAKDAVQVNAMDKNASRCSEHQRKQAA